MDSGTDTWVIVLAAFGGGLLGAVLQPALTHILELIRAGATIRKRREQSLRKMLMSQIREGRQFLARSLRFEMAHRLGRPLDHTERMQLIDQTMEGTTQKSPDYLWQPERIEDDGLRNSANDYAQTAADLWGESTMKNPDYSRVIALSQRLESLQKQITARMDELNWPESDDSAS